MLPPAPDAPETPSNTTTPFPPPTGAQVLRALRAPAIGYAWLLAGAVAMTALVLIAANVGSTAGDTGVDADDTNAAGVLIGMPFQIAAMSLLGSLRFTQDGVHASLFLPPLLLTALYLVAAARAARRSDVVPAAGTRAILGVVVGFVTAVPVSLATWALAMRDNGAAVHAASVGLFFGTWALTGAASYLGTSRAAGATRPRWIPSDYAIAARVWLGSLLLWVVVAAVILTVVAIVKEGLWVGLLVPLWGATVGLDTYAVSHLGALDAAGATLNIGDFSAGWTIVGVVGALALALLTSCAWHLRRGVRGSALAQPGAWAVLPVTYVLGGFLVWLVPTVAVGGAYGAFGSSVTVRPVFWVVFVLLAWGVVVETASRFVAPSLVLALPVRVRDLLRGPEPAAPLGSPAKQPADQPASTPVAPRPLSAEERARYKRIGIAAGAVAAVGLIAWIAVSVINSQFYSPKDQAAAYLDAVVDGDLAKVAELAPTDADADDALLTGQIYQAARNRITGYEIGDVETEDDDTVTVTVRVKGVPGPAKTELTLQKDGHTGVLFDKWKVIDGGLARSVSLTLPDNAGDVTVNDVDVDAFGDDVWLLPGDYVFDAFSGNKWLESPRETVTVAVDTDYQVAEVPGAVASDAFREEVQRQVDAYLDQCMASTDLDPDGCPNSAYGSTDARNVHWTLDEAPTPDFDSFDGTFPADLSYGESGTATVSYESDQSYGFGAPDWQSETEESDLYLSSVTVTEQGQGLVVEIDA